MSETQIAVLCCILAYFALMIWVGYRQSKVQDHKGFIIGAREVGYFATTGAIAASFRDGSGLVFWIGSAYSIKYGGMGFFIGLFLSMSVFSILATRIRDLSIEKGYITVGQMIRLSIGKYSERFSGILILVFAMLNMGLQLYVSGNIFATVLNQPAIIGLLAVALIVLFYLWEGGYGSVVKTDVFQFALILGLVIVPFFLDIKKDDLLDIQSLGSMGWSDSIGLFLLGVFLPVACGDNWQRIFSAKSNKVAKYSFPLAGIALVIMTLNLIWIGFGLKSVIPDADPSKIIFVMFQQEALSRWMLCFIGVAFMAVTMSTLDTSTYLFTSTILKNFVPEKYTSDRNDYVRISKIVMVVSMAIMVGIAMTIADIIQFLFDAVSLLVILSPVFVFAASGWFKKSRKADIFLTVTMALCTAVYIYMFANNMFKDMILTSIPCGLSLIGCIATVILGKTVFKENHAVKA